MANRKYSHDCLACHERPATHPPGTCERCYRRRRYNDPNDSYRANVQAYKREYRERKKGAVHAAD